jgi:hypothetical protein
MPKLDFKKDYAEFFNPSANQVAEVDLPTFRYLMIDGDGAPPAPRYQEALATLYPVAYTLKFALKPDHDFKVGPLETLWWVDAPGGFLLAVPADWRWTAMIIVPDFVGEEHLAAAIAELRRKGKTAPLLDSIRLETLDEGACVQIMHVGPYAAETETIRRLHDYMTDNGLEARGHHHEIYLSDPRTTAPERLRTVIRQPVHVPAP